MGLTEQKGYDYENTKNISKKIYFKKIRKMNVYKRGMSFADGRDGLPMACFSKKNYQVIQL